jgi:hypothetical protein
MVRVQSGISPTVTSALVAAVKSSGALGPWNGAWAFALKVLPLAHPQASPNASHICMALFPFAFVALFCVFFLLHFVFAVKPQRGGGLSYVTLSRGCFSLRVKWQRGERASSIMARKYMRRIWGSSAAHLR